MRIKKILLSLSLIVFSICLGAAEQAMINVYGRDFHLLNGKWNVIVDLYDQGRRMEVYKNRVPQTKEEFYEYSFENGMRLNVPGDWNSQSSELKYYEGTVWYGRHFEANISPDKRQFLYFGAVSYRCRVYLNGHEIASHEGGFTPFQVEVTDVLSEGDNFLVVEVNNTRSVDAIPAMAFDWWNYGGITRDVMLVTTPRLFIRDYFVRLDNVQKDLIHATVALSAKGVRDVRIEIPELNIERTLQTNEEGVGSISLKVRKLELWEPEKARLYKVVITSEEDKIEEEIGFRQITVDGTRILVNGNPIILWQEIPIWQGIDFEDRGTMEKAQTMLGEMINRDKNRCAVCFWGVANETKPSDARNSFLLSLLEKARSIDRSRLYVAAFDLVYFNKETRHFEMDDPFTSNLDVVAVNKYMGWYHPWPLSPEEAIWDVVPDKPLIISEFGGEALYGQHGDEEVTSSWSEEYQAKLYRDNIEMFNHIPNLCGVSPWVLFDFRSPFRFHPTNQDGWNRKGLLSDQGLRKKAWYIMHDYYQKKKYIK